MTLPPELELDPAAAIGHPWQLVDTPALLVDLDRLDANIARMAELARRQGLALRPHFKTHKSPAIARRQVAAGAVGMTVAKLDEAAVLLEAGISDLLVAYEIVAEPKLSRAMALATRGHLAFAVDGPEGARALSAAASSAGFRVGLSIEVECGLHRCGVMPADARALAEVIVGLPGVALTGVFTHAGNAYAAANREEVEAIARGEAAAVREAAAAIRSAGIDVPSVSVGSTPTAELVAREPGITELRPGNYVFYDAMQVALGTVPQERVTLSVASTVVSRVVPERAVIDAGSKTLGLDRGVQSRDTLSDFGRLADGAEGALERLSEEHGILRVPSGSPFAPGDRVRVVPNHACSVGNLGRWYVGVRDGQVAEILPIEAAGGVR